MWFNQVRIDLIFEELKITIKSKEYLGNQMSIFVKKIKENWRKRLTNFQLEECYHQLFSHGFSRKFDPSAQLKPALTTF